MAVRMRLTRVGSKKNPIYRVVVADQRSPRDGRFIEIVGRYNPQPDPSIIEFDEEKVKEWLGKGAQPSDAVAKLLKVEGSRHRRQDESCPRFLIVPTELVLYLAQRLVSEPDAVRVEELDGPDGELVLRLHVAEADRGMIIGRRGRTVQSLRILARAAGARRDRRTMLEIAEDD